MSSIYRNRPVNLEKVRSRRENAARSAATSRMRGSSIARVAEKCCGDNIASSIKNHDILPSLGGEQHASGMLLGARKLTDEVFIVAFVSVVIYSHPVRQSRNLPIVEPTQPGEIHQIICAYDRQSEENFGIVCYNSYGNIWDYSFISSFPFLSHKPRIFQPSKYAVAFLLDMF